MMCVTAKERQKWNPDVKAAGVNPLDHFARHDQSEGRAQPVPEVWAHMP
jgi:hypothetical protein